MVNYMTTLLNTILLTVAVLLGSSQAGLAQDWGRGNEAYESGDYATALKEFRPLAEQGHPGAQRSLGYMYGNGKGVVVDYIAALKWYRKSAEQGNAAGQGSLGYVYEKGEGVPIDKVYAYMWFDIASRNGSDRAKARRDNLVKGMTSLQLEEAKILARECMKKEYKDC